MYLTIKTLKLFLQRPFCFVGKHNYEPIFIGITQKDVYYCEACKDFVQLNNHTFKFEAIEISDYHFNRLHHMQNILETRFVIIEKLKKIKPNPHIFDPTSPRPRRRVSSANRGLVSDYTENIYLKKYHLFLFV